MAQMTEKTYFTPKEGREWSEGGVEMTLRVRKSVPADTNEHRVFRATLVTKAYAEACGDPEEGSRPSWLLSDLMHFCLSRGVDFDHELEQARVHFTQEARGWL